MALIQFPCIVSTADTDTEKSGLCATETAIILAGQQWIAAGQHYLQLTRGLAYACPLTPAGLLSGKVHPHGTGWVRQLRCLNRVVQRIVRGPHAQIYRHMRQEHIPGALSGQIMWSQTRRLQSEPDDCSLSCK